MAKTKTKKGNSSEFDVNELRNKVVKDKPVKFVGNNVDISNLTWREELYFRLMYPKSGVLYIKGEPGKAKSAILRSIADKLNLFYIDLRLSQIDETDVGLFPDKVKLNVKYLDNKGIEKEKEEYFLTHIIPEWAYLANNPKEVNENYKGTLINFEELNRAPLAVRNAALQLLLERQIGFRGFEFSDNVYMASTGNLGEEDDTDVEEFDAALKDRLISVKHDMDYPEWRDTWAINNVHSSIISYLNQNAEDYYNKPNSDKKEDVFPTPRSWTFLSDMIRDNFSVRNEDGDIIEEARIDDRMMMDFVSRTAHYYIGHISHKFVKFLNDMNKLTIYDILGGDESSKYKKGYIEMPKEEKNNIDRSKRSELLEKFKKIDITKLSDIQRENLKLFILNLKSDEACSFYLKVLDDDLKDLDVEDINPAVIDILSDKRFSKIREQLSDSVNSV